MKNVFAWIEAFAESSGRKTTGTTTAQPQKPVSEIKELLYPGELPTFETLAEEKHSDQRALIYTISRLDPERERPFSDEEISCLDFGNKSAACSVLKKARLIRPLENGEELEARLTRDELLALAQERGLHTSGNKRALVDRLAESGYKIDRRKHRGRLFRLTELGINAVLSSRSDRQEAVAHAIEALKEMDYQGAIAAYRKFDNQWAFAHTSGKLHTMFACYDIPYSRFRFFENYPMYELHNDANFKATLRACLLAGLMRGCQERWELTLDFKSVCNEKINCPCLPSLFDYDPVILENMRRQAEFSPDNATEYYISHLLYLSRHEK